MLVESDMQRIRNSLSMMRCALVNWPSLVLVAAVSGTGTKEQGERRYRYQLYLKVHTYRHAHT